MTNLHGGRNGSGLVRRLAERFARAAASNLARNRSRSGAAHDVRDARRLRTDGALSAEARSRPASTRRQWEDLVRFATGEGDARDAQFTKVLVLVRNNAAAHYYQPNALVTETRAAAKYRYFP